MDVLCVAKPGEAHTASCMSSRMGVPCSISVYALPARCSLHARMFCADFGASSIGKYVLTLDFVNNG